MTELLLCKDCKWYRKDWVSHILNGTHHYDTCASPNTTQNDGSCIYVTGCMDKSAINYNPYAVRDNSSEFPRDPF